MELHADKPRVIAQLNDLHALAAIVAADEVQPGLGEARDVGRVDFVAVTVAFVDGGGIAVEFAEAGPE